MQGQATRGPELGLSVPQERGTEGQDHIPRNACWGAEELLIPKTMLAPGQMSVNNAVGKHCEREAYNLSCFSARACTVVKELSMSAG